jgi:MIP family channel proteins
MYDLWKSLVTEFLGTFVLVFVGAGASAVSIQNGGSPVVTALALGLAYIVLIYTLGDYSGANFNPAISFGLAAVGKLGWCRMLLYWIVQFLGALAGAALIGWIYGIDFGVGGDMTIEQPGKVFVLEMILTFFLVLAFLFMTRNPLVSLISGFVIGLALTADILVGGFFARIGVNPAYSLATEVFTGNWNNFWIFLVGPLVGALLAAIVYRLMIIPWSCSELAEIGCENDCGRAPFFEQWKDCTDEFKIRGRETFEAAKAELNLRGDVCTSPCDVGKCDLPVAPKRGRNYRYTPQM